MKKNIALLASSILIFAFSCKEGNKTDGAEESNKMKEVMAIHDEVMPKMGTVGKLVSMLKTKVDTTAQGQEYQKAIRDLQAANESMMEWMQDFGTNFDSEEIMNGKVLTEEKQRLLIEEENEIKAVKEKIETSISTAEALLKD